MSKHFPNPFDMENRMVELYCFSSGVPAEPESAANILKAVDIGRSAIEAFITGCLNEKHVLLNDPIRQNKLKTFATSKVSKTIRSSIYNLV